MKWLAKSKKNKQNAAKQENYDICFYVIFDDSTAKKLIPGEKTEHYVKFNFDISQLFD